MGTKKGVWIGCFKDMGSESVVAPPTWKALKEGYATHLFIEGKGGERFLKNYLPELGYIPPNPCSVRSVWVRSGNMFNLSMGPVNFETQPYGFDPMDYVMKRLYGGIGEESPTAVLVGESKPIYAERLIAHAVMEINKHRMNKIKLVCCQDFWSSGVIVAPDIVYSMAQVNDEYAAELTLKTYPYLSERDIIIRGNPGVKTVKVRPEITEKYAELRKQYDTVYFFPGGSEPRTSKELMVLYESLCKTHGSWCLVVGWHPKLVEEFGSLWRKIIEPFGPHVIEAEPGTGDEWGSTADVIVSGWSTIMTTAAYARKRVIAINTPEGAVDLSLRSMEQIPQVAMGWADCISEPSDLSGLGVVSDKAYAKLVPYDTQKAYESIVELLEEN